MKLKEYFEKEFDKNKNEYNILKEKMDIEIERINKIIENNVKEYGCKYMEVEVKPFKKCKNIVIEWSNNNKYITYEADVWSLRYGQHTIASTTEYNRIIDKLNDKRDIITMIKDILNNKERYVSINKSKLFGASNYYNIELLTKSGEYNASSFINGKIEGNLDGGFDGSKAFGFGSIGGSIEGNLDGYIKGKSDAEYDEKIIAKITYNLDYELDDYELDILTIENVLEVLKNVL